MMVGFRTRLTAALIALVALTAGATGVFAYVLVRDSLRDRLVEEAIARSEYNLAILSSNQGLDPAFRPDQFEASGLADRFFGAEGYYIEFEGGGRVASELGLLGTAELLSDELREILDRGEIGYEFLTIDDAPALAVGFRPRPAGSVIIFFYRAEAVEDALVQLWRLLTVASFAVVLLGTVAANLVARRVLRPVAEAGWAAQSMAEGDLSVRLPVESDDEIGNWAEAFNQMATSLEQQITALQEAQEHERRFVADVSHELRTPITALVNEAAALVKHLDALSDSGRHVGEMLIGDVDRMRRLVEDLLEISRLETGIPVDVSVVEVEPFLDAIIAERHPGTRLRVVGIEDRVPVDRRALERIVGNLLDNAFIHASGASTTVTVSADAGVLRIAVADEGPGVADSDLDRLFDRFYKSDSAGRGGSGLGLAIARQHARHLGGDLTVRRGMARGLVFEVMVPVADLLPAGDGDATSQCKPVEGEAGTTQRRS
jgi:two-component system sensor histidine kinase MtrB